MAVPPTLNDLQRRCSDVYHRLSDEARDAPVNHLRPGLPVRLLRPARFAFLPTVSLGIQWLVPVASSLHDSLCSLRDDFRTHCPAACESVFWQPPATFHMNIAILVRLSCDRAGATDYDEALSRAAPLLRELTWMDAFDIQFRGALVTADGTLLARGYPKDLRPFQIRRAFMAAGFADQQAIFHITVGRVLSVLTPSDWRRLSGFARKQQDRPLGVAAVDEAILIKEREGFLHSASCYDVLAEYHWPSRQATRHFIAPPQRVDAGASYSA